MKSAAVIVGIDNYLDQPLTSAVNDAQAFSDLLLRLKLVEKRQDITLITAPLGGAKDDASHAKIKNSVYPFFKNPSRCDRLYFFFSGHGISAYTGPGHTVISTVLLAQDVESLDRDGGFMIDFTELRNLLRASGPKEQFFFIDACRDMEYEEYPVVGQLGWGGHQNASLPSNNCQATLLAVAPLGRARALINGLGVMTSHLLRALEDDTLAVEYDSDSDMWQISMKSLKEYVRGKVEDTVKQYSFPDQIFLLPELDAPDPPVKALRELNKTPVAPLMVHIAPDDAADETTIRVFLYGQEIRDQSIPPKKNHDILELHPQRYCLKTDNPHHAVDPKYVIVDVRRQSEFTFNVEANVPTVILYAASRDPAQATELPSRPPTGDTPASPYITIHACPDCGQLGRISAWANDQYTLVEVNGLEPPFLKRSQLGDLELDLPPGPYRVRFRMSDKVFNQKDIYVMPAERTSVRSTIAYTPMIGEMLGIRNNLPEAAEVSESLGGLQGELLDITLPIIALKPFDETDSYFHQFDELVEKARPDPEGASWLSIVLAADGNEWPAWTTPSQMLESASIWVDGGLFSTRVQMRPLSRATLWRENSESVELGLNRVRLGLEPFPEAGRFHKLSFESERFGNFRIALAVGAERATVLTLIMQPDGRLAIRQSLMRYPGKEHLYVERGEPHADGYTGDLIKEVQLVQNLYLRGDLAETGLDLLKKTASAEILELSANCMVYYAWQKRLQSEAVDATDAAYVRSALLVIADNLNKYFGEFPDAQVVYGQAFPETKSAVYSRLLETQWLPILAESTRRLAWFAEESGYERSLTEVLKWARRIPAGQIWTAISY